MRKLAAKIKGVFYHGKAYISLIAALIYDNTRYCKNALIGWSWYRPNLKNLEAQIIKLYHVIEKGLAMPDFRPRFGAPRLHHLIRTMSRFIDAGGSKENRHYASAIICLSAYLERHQKLGIDVDDIISPATLAQLSGPNESVDSQAKGGVESVSREKLFSQAESSFAAFAASRRSCRTFDQDCEVPNEAIQKAIAIAVHTPSVCNRQAWKVHEFHARETIDQLLSYQNGNLGFGHSIPCLLIVTIDLQCFDGVIERYQPWIDGGMFGMTLLFALHHLHLRAVPLNWSVRPAADRGLRQAAQIPAPESIIMLIGVGVPAQHASIPVSQRRATNEVLSTEGKVAQ